MSHIKGTLRLKLEICDMYMIEQAMNIAPILV
jgi:hypothetical protein